MGTGNVLGEPRPALLCSPINRMRGYPNDLRIVPKAPFLLHALSPCPSFHLGSYRALSSGGVSHDGLVPTEARRLWYE